MKHREKKRLAGYKICVYAISRNEEKFVDRWMDSVGEADLVVVADTGSTDGTVQRLRDRGALVYEESIIPWRFDVARNCAMDHIPGDIDICVSNDIDEVFEPGWREKLERAWNPDCTRGRYWFAWSSDDSGNIIKKFPMEKIHLRKGFRWIHPVHEVLEYSGSMPDHTVFIDGLLLIHKPDPEKSRSQYLPLLELSAKENPDDDRTMFWLGREYIFKGQYDNGIKTLLQHLKFTSAWDEERSASMRFIGRAYRYKGDFGEARRWFFRAAAECERVREPWVDLALLGYLEKDWVLSLFAAEKGLEITQNTNSYLVEPDSWAHTLPDYAAIACYWLGQFEKGYEYADLACRLRPGDERLMRNRSLMKPEPIEKVEGE